MFIIIIIISSSSVCTITILAHTILSHNMTTHLPPGRLWWRPRCRTGCTFPGPIFAIVSATRNARVGWSSKSCPNSFFLALGAPRSGHITALLLLCTYHY